METKKVYTAPELTVVTCRVEQGYAASSTNPLAALQVLSSLLTGLNGGNMEAWDFDQTDNTFGQDAINWE